jgi:hypothetical protein
MFSLTQILIDGLLMSLALSVLIFASLRYNPRLWLQDYPKAVRETQPPLTKEEKRARLVMALPFMLLMLGIPFWSTYQLRIANGGTLDFLTAYLNTFLVLNIFNLFDAVVIDYLILSVMKPKFAFIPGTEALMQQVIDWRWHVRGYLVGIIFCAVGGLIITAVAMII